MTWTEEYRSRTSGYIGSLNINRGSTVINKSRSPALVTQPRLCDKKSVTVILESARSEGNGRPQ